MAPRRGPHSGAPGSWLCPAGPGPGAGAGLHSHGEGMCRQAIPHSDTVYAHGKRHSWVSGNASPVGPDHPPQAHTEGRGETCRALPVRCQRHAGLAPERPARLGSGGSKQQLARDVAQGSHASLCPAKDPAQGQPPHAQQPTPPSQDRLCPGGALGAGQTYDKRGTVRAADQTSRSSGGRVARMDSSSQK